MSALAVLCTLLAALFNAAWTAISKSALRDLPADRFTPLMRAGAALLLFPFFAWRFDTGFGAAFWFWLALAGLLETLAISVQSLGVRTDYYATFSLVNTAPFFALLIAPGMLGERLGAPLVRGVLLIVAGAILFFPGGCGFPRSASSPPFFSR